MLDVYILFFGQHVSIGVNKNSLSKSYTVVVNSSITPFLSKKNSALEKLYRTILKLIFHPTRHNEEFHIYRYIKCICILTFCYCLTRLRERGGLVIECQSQDRDFLSSNTAFVPFCFIQQDAITELSPKKRWVASRHD